MPSSSRAVASTPGLPQYPISPAPTSTPLGADPDGIDEDWVVGAAGDEQLTASNTLRAGTIRQIRLNDCPYRPSRGDSDARSSALAALRVFSRPRFPSWHAYS